MFVLTIYGYYLKLAVRNWNIIVEALILMVMTMMVRIVKLMRRRRRMRVKKVQLFWDWWWRWWQGRGWLRLVSGRLVAGRDQGERTESLGHRSEWTLAQRISNSTWFQKVGIFIHFPWVSDQCIGRKKINIPVFLNKFLLIRIEFSGIRGCLQMADDDGEEEKG